MKNYNSRDVSSIEGHFYKDDLDLLLRVVNDNADVLKNLCDRIDMLETWAHFKVKEDMK